MQFKQYLNVNGKTPRSMTMDFGGTTEGDSELKTIFGKKVFSYPKSIKYFLTLISTVSAKDITVLDFCGSSGMFVQSEKFVQSHSDNRGNISVYGQKSNADTWQNYYYLL